MNNAAPDTVDLLVIGGGINGAGIARDAAGRGLSVVLCEQGDLAGGTSSASSKMIHGGLRYLEHYEFRLVREALAEREVLLENAPHLVHPLRFVLPHDALLRPAWMIRAGLFLYDRLGGSRRRLAGSHGLDLAADPAGEPLRDERRKGFVYTDCRVDDSRLVVLNALGAAQHGATILTRTCCVQARRDGDAWIVVLRDAITGRQRSMRARILVNAAGPWVNKVLDASIATETTLRVRLVKGSHIVVARLYDGDHAYILQNDDGRVVFALPFEENFTLIGTTDVPYAGDPNGIRIDSDEIDYLCAAINRYFERPIGAGDVVWSYAGVRPLLDDGAGDPAAVTRDYRLEIEAPEGGAPLLSVFGGKITTYRRLAEQAMAKLSPFTPGVGGPWTASSPLPGGDIDDADVARFLNQTRARYPWLPAGLAARYVNAYGTLTAALLDGADGLDDLGHDFGASLFEREVAYLADTEWARSAEDILWRRSKLGLVVPEETASALDDWFAGRDPDRAPAACRHHRTAAPNREMPLGADNFARTTPSAALYRDRDR